MANNMLNWPNIQFRHIGTKKSNSKSSKHTFTQSWSLATSKMLLQQSRASLVYLSTGANKVMNRPKNHLNVLSDCEFGPKDRNIFHIFKVFTAEVSTIEPTTMMKEGWSKGHQSPYYWASSQCWSKFLLPVIDFVIIFPVLMCCPAKGRHYGEVLFNLL